MQGGFHGTTRSHANHFIASLYHTGGCGVVMGPSSSLGVGGALKSGFRVSSVVLFRLFVRRLLLIRLVPTYSPSIFDPSIHPSVTLLRLLLPPILPSLILLPFPYSNPRRNHRELQLLNHNGSFHSLHPQHRREDPRRRPRLVSHAHARDAIAQSLTCACNRNLAVEAR